jgi:8-oxo-dGTP pyrophosphatase MutT (NUDIX family)
MFKQDAGAVAMKEIVVGAIIHQGDRLLLVQQRKVRAFGLWSFPGGHVEAGESLLEALEREITEELGLSLTNVVFLRVDKNDVGFEHHAYIGHVEGDVTLLHDELMGFGWFRYQDLQAMAAQLRAPFVLELAELALNQENR